MYLDQQDYDGIGSSLARDILNHNEYGKCSCGLETINKSPR